MSKIINIHFIVAFLIAIFNTQIVLANVGISKNKTSEVTKDNFIVTTIKSKFIKITRNSQIAKFTGNVVVEREDVSFLADEMLVYYNESQDKESKESKESVESAPESGSIKKIEATNNVKIFHQDFIATGQSGFYDPKVGNFIVRDNVVFNSGVSAATGQEFIYNINTKKGYLVGDDKVGKKLGKDKRVLMIIGDDIKTDKNNKVD